jgi:hypothetical protein
MEKITSFYKEKPLACPSQSYLLGLRGLLVLQSFLWVFLRTFVPATVKDSSNPDGPLYQILLRKTLSVLFWNETMIYSSIILLSARTICIPFLATPSRSIAASSIFRRGIRLWFPAAVSLALIKIISSCISLSNITAFATAIGNHSLTTPYEIPNALAYFNAVFNIFWVTDRFNLQAASKAFPTQTLWIVSVIFEQSYTVYMTMIIIPYTRKEWRVLGGVTFILTAWWVQSWAWYTITGMVLADAVMNMDFKMLSKEGIPLGRWSYWNRFNKVAFPSWFVYGILCIAGLLMQYLWTDRRPDLQNAEIRIHTGNYYNGGLNDLTIPGQPLARDDNYLLLLGFFLFLESTDWLQMVFRNPLFLYLGKRSFSESYMLSIFQKRC